MMQSRSHIIRLQSRFMLALILTLSLGLMQAKAADKEEVRRASVSKQVVGEVSGISKNFIAIDYAQDANAAYEIALTMDKDTKGARKDLKEIGVGDIVAVTYEEISETKKGENPKVVKRLAKVVEFRQAARIKPETGVLESREGETRQTGQPSESGE